MNEISLKNIAAAKLHHEPFKWAYLDSTFDCAAAGQVLMAQFPEDNFHRLQSQRVDKSYSMRARTVASGMDGLTKNWCNLLRSLESEVYRHVLGTLIGINLADFRQEITLCKYGAGDSLSPHTDKADKIVTHILYFSDLNWSPSDGGCLDILAGPDSATVVRRIVPRCGGSAILVRSDQSWHAVTPQVRVGRERRTLQVVFHRSRLQYSNDLRSAELDSMTKSVRNAGNS